MVGAWYWIRGDSYALYLSWPQAWRSGSLGDWIDTVDTYAFIFYLSVLYTVKVKLKTYSGPLHLLLSNHSSKVLALTPNSSHDLSSPLSIVP